MKMSHQKTSFKILIGSSTGMSHKESDWSVSCSCSWGGHGTISCSSVDPPGFGFSRLIGSNTAGVFSRSFKGSK